MTNTQYAKHLPVELTNAFQALNVRESSPIEIDTVLAKLSGLHARLTYQLSHNTEWLHRVTRSTTRAYNRQTGRTETSEPKFSTSECVKIVEREIGLYQAARAVGEWYSISLESVYDVLRAADMIVERAELQGATEALNRAIGVLQREWTRRGQWSRTFLVTSSAGHLHSSKYCQTCNRGRNVTTFGWWPELSGLSQAEMIAQLDKHADALCSVCYPDAPVAAKRTNITKATAAKLTTE